MALFNIFMSRKNFYKNLEKSKMEVCGAVVLSEWSRC